MRRAVCLIFIMAVVMTSGCTTTSQVDSEAPAVQPAAAPEEATAGPETNLLLAEWVGPYGGLPAFDGWISRT
jgi:peptidyl-dipeptidase Dcp